MSGAMITSIHPVFPPVCYKRLLLSCCITLALTNLASAQTFNVSVANDDGSGKINTLSWAILQANKHPGGDFVNLQTDVTITDVMKRLIDSDITLKGNNHFIDGDHRYRPLFIKSGSVNLNHLQLVNGLALGGSSGVGGAGAGLGGSLFIHSGAVTLDHVSIDNSEAIGGTAGLDSGQGGGGMFGNAHDTGGGGAGLFSDNSGGFGGYAGYGQYGGSGGLYDAYDASKNGGDGGFAGGGGRGKNGGAGGLAGGGGYGVENNGGNGGFGGGGGYGWGNVGGAGGFGAGGGGGYSGVASGGWGAGNGSLYCEFNDGKDSDYGHGGGGAGFGGGIFVQQGTLTLSDVGITRSTATRGLGIQGDCDQSGNGVGKGGAIFICTEVQSSECSSLVSDNSCAVTYNQNSADDGDDNIFAPGNLDFPASCNSSCDLPAQLVTGSVPYSCPDLRLLSNFWIATGGVATLSATNSIELGSGFSVAAGGIASVSVNP